MLYLSLKKEYNNESGFTKRSRTKQSAINTSPVLNHLYYGASQMTYTYLTPNPIRCKVVFCGGVE